MWPCSQLRGRSIRVNVDENGLVDLKARPFTREEQAHGIPGDELEAIVSDFTRGTDAAGFWPCWQRR